MGCLEWEMLVMRDVRNVGVGHVKCPGCWVFGGVGCVRCGKLGLWNVWDVERPE